MSRGAVAATALVIGLTAGTVAADTLHEFDARAVIAMSWPQHLVPKALRVAWCESRWDPMAENRGLDRVYGRYASLGLFQIETEATTAWADLATTIFPEGDVWHDPAKNARMAHEIYQRQGWSAWPHCGRL